MTEINANEPLAISTFLMRWNAEIVGFYSKRLQECSLLPFNMLLCSSPDDFADLQDKFGANLRSDYASTAEKLALLASDPPAPTSSAESYGSIILAAQRDAREIIEQAQAQARRILDQAEAQRPVASRGSEAA